MNKSIRLLIEGFFDDEIFNTDNDIKSDIEDLGKYYEYKVGDIFYQNKKPYAICCGESKYFNDKTNRFMLLFETKFHVCFSDNYKLVGKLHKIKNLKLDNFSSSSEFKPYSYNIKELMHIDENGYKNTQIIKNNFKLINYPAFNAVLQINNNCYLPSIDELQIMQQNKDNIYKIIKSLKFNYDIFNYNKICSEEHRYYPLISSTQLNSHFCYCIYEKYERITVHNKKHHGIIIPFYKIS